MPKPVYRVPEPDFECKGIKLYYGDCLKILPRLQEQFTACVCDPPYGLEFMGKGWDHGVLGIPFWEAILRVLKPGAPFLAFGGTRTFHRLICAIEDAGFEIRDCLMWVYGQGFCKSLNISKAIDKAAGAEREVAGKYIHPSQGPGWSDFPSTTGKKETQVAYGDFAPNPRTITAPATEAAKLWDGWGTGLSPSWEPITLAMKPRDGTFVNNALEHGVAGLAIEKCRITTGSESQAMKGPLPLILSDASFGTLESCADWLSRIVSELRSCNIDGKVRFHNEDGLGDIWKDDGRCEPFAVRLFPNGVWCGCLGSGVQGSLSDCPSCRHSCDELFRQVEAGGQDGLPSLADALERIARSQRAQIHNRDCQCNDRLSSSDGFPLSSFCHLLLERFTTLYYTTPPHVGQAASRWPANFVHDGSAEVVRLFPDTKSGTAVGGLHRRSNKTANCYGEFKGRRAEGDVCFGDSGSAARFFYQAKASRKDRTCNGKVVNKHATVKPRALMEWLCKLVSPPENGVILDPFMGSGSTGIGAIMAGNQFIGIEKDQDSFNTAVERIETFVEEQEDVLS